MSRVVSAGEKVAFLSDPRRYAHRPRRVTVIETHFAWVFLAGRSVYKLKRPTRQGSADYRTLANRERGCRGEVALNRRLAPAVYLGVVPLMLRRDGTLTLGRGDVVVDWLVRMRRLPASRMLDRAVASGTVTERDLLALARRLSAFYARADRRPMSADDYVAHLRRRATRNARDLRAPDLGLPRSRIDAVIREQREFLRRARDLLAGRGARLVDGHGDLRAEHVGLGREPCVIDCLEFDPALRRLDPAEEVSLLALECRRLGAPRLAGRLLDLCRAAMHDPFPAALVEFYTSQQATTRAKLAAWHVRDRRYRRRKWIARARSYLRDADRHAARALRAIGAPEESVRRPRRPVAK